MANKRMFTMKIVDSDAFLDMPLSTQALYFHLNMRADDDGFVGNPKKIMRLIGATDDDFRILVAKNFLLLFDNGVIVIKHWRMHNTLSSGRYHETSYLSEKEILLLKKNGAYSLTEGEKIDDAKLLEMADRQSRRTKDEQKTNADIDKDIDKDINNISSKKIEIDYQEIINLYHENCPSLPKVTKITDARKKLINARLKDYSIGELVNAFCVAEASDFLTGRNGKWKASFDWIMNTNNIVKILEGNYVNKTKQKDGYSDFNDIDKMEKDIRVKSKNPYKNYIHGNYDFEQLERELREK